MTWDDAAYFRNRADQERALATTAKDPIAAEIHRVLAARYDERATGEQPTGHVTPTRQF
jgi:hypothetical protein